MKELTGAEAGLWLFIRCQEYPLYREHTTASIENPFIYLEMLASGGDETLARTAKSIKAKLWGMGAST